MINLSHTLPEIQFQFGQFSNSPFLSASKYGLLGLDKDFLLLTSCVVGDGNILHKAAMTNNYGGLVNGLQINSELTSLNFVTHFHASRSNGFYSGHLEQIDLMWLQQLNLEDNFNCLIKSFQCLHVLASSCQKLQGLNIMGIKKVENCLRLWEILVDLKLGIELAMLFDVLQ